MILPCIGSTFPSQIENRLWQYNHANMLLLAYVSWKKNQIHNQRHPFVFKVSLNSRMLISVWCYCATSLHPFDLLLALLQPFFIRPRTFIFFQQEAMFPNIADAKASWLIIIITFISTSSSVEGKAYQNQLRYQLVTWFLKQGMTKS